MLKGFLSYFMNSAVLRQYKQKGGSPYRTSSHWDRLVRRTLVMRIDVAGEGGYSAFPLTWREFPAKSRRGDTKMKRHPAMLPIILATSFVLVVATQSARAQKLAGPNRPATVPEGYAITPFGYFHPSCVREVASGDTVLADGRVQHADGTADAKAPVCGYARYTAKGEIVA